MPTLLPSHDHLKKHPRQLPEAVENSLSLLREGAHLNSYVTLLDDRAAVHAKKVSEALLSGEQLPLGGWIIAVKDNINIKNTRLTCASKILENFESLYSATAVERLEQAGAVVVCKTNMDEFAMGSSSENTIFGTVRNPINPDLVAGGSSGGSAVTVAAGWVHAALGSETGGSVRQPASFCGIAGLKPTYGRVSRYGLVAFGSSLDQIAPFAKTSKDIFDIMCAMSGQDKNDSTSVNKPVPKRNEGLTSLNRKLRIGLPKEYFVGGISDEVAEVIKFTAKSLENNGHIVTEISLPHTELAIPVYYIIAPAEASSNLARYDGVRYGFLGESRESLLELYESTRAGGFGREVRRRIMIGTYVLSAGYYDAFYKKAQKVRRLLFEDFKNAFEEVDLLLTPTTPTTAFKIGEKLSDPVAMYLSDIFTAPANLAGVPALSVPKGKDKQGLPIGVQIIGPHFAEELVLQLGAEIESLQIN